MKNIFFITILSILMLSCTSRNKKENVIAEFQKTILEPDTILVTNGFDFPVGKPNAKDYYNAQKFKENNHLGEDWNGVGGGNSDIGDPIYAIANGYVSFAENKKGGWGNVVRIVHYITKEQQLESLYAHCLDIKVQTGD